MFMLVCCQQRGVSDSESNESQGVSQMSFRLDADANGLAYDDEAAVALNTVLSDWFSASIETFDSKTGNDGLDYALAKSIERIAIMRSSVPGNYAPLIVNIDSYLLDAANEGFKKNEVCVRIDEYDRIDENNIKIVFLNMGKGFIGGAWVTYHLTRHKGVWLIKSNEWFDP